jgi:small-conductance mechanosensitive channel
VERYTVRKVNVDGATATTVTALGYLARMVFWLVILLLALDNFGVDVTTLVTGLGITGIAVALAVQNILGDLLGALSIVVDKPFVVGDTINVDTFTGTVEHIGLKTTRVRSLSGEQIIFSNADLLKARIRNYKRLVERRVVFVTAVRYDTPREKLTRIPAMLKELVLAHQPVRFDRSHFRGFAESALEFETVYFVLTDDYLRYMDIQQAINLEILRRFEQEEIEFAFPTRTIVYKVEGPVPPPGALQQLAEAAVADER